MAYLQIHLFDRRGKANIVAVSGFDGKEAIEYAGAIPFEYRGRLRKEEISLVRIEAHADRVSPTLSLLVLLDGERLADVRCDETKTMEAQLG